MLYIMLYFTLKTTINLSLEFVLPSHQDDLMCLFLHYTKFKF